MVLTFGGLLRLEFPVQLLSPVPLRMYWHSRKLPSFFVLFSFEMSVLSSATKSCGNLVVFRCR